MNHRITVSLITYNSEKFLEQSLPTLTNQTEPISIIVTDNNSSDKTISLVKEILPQATLIANRQNLGFCMPHNKVISWCVTPYILILNPDVMLEPDYCEKLADYLDENPNCASVSGLLYRWHLDQEINRSEIDSAGLKLQKNGQVYDLNDIDNNQTDQQVFGVSGASACYRVQSLKSTALYQHNKVMFYDENYYIYKEDVDLAFRLRLAGFDSVCNYKAIGYHQRGLSGSVSLKQRLKMEINRSNNLAARSIANHYKTLFKNLTGSDLKKIFIPVFALFATRILITLVIKPKVAYIVLKDLLTSFPLLYKQRKYIQTQIKKIGNFNVWYNN